MAQKEASTTSDVSEQLDTNFLSKLAAKFDKEHERLGAGLNVEAAIVSRILHDNNCTVTRTLKILQKWRDMSINRRNSRAMFDELCSAFSKCDRNDIVEFVRNRQRRYVTPKKEEQAAQANTIYLTDDLLCQLATKIGSAYRELGLLLGMADYTISEIEANYHGNVANITHTILEKWMKADKGQDMYEMYNELLDALSGIERNDLVAFVKDGARHPSETDQQGHKTEIGKKERHLKDEMKSLEQQYKERHLEEELKQLKEEIAILDKRLQKTREEANDEIQRLTNQKDKLQNEVDSHEKQIPGNDEQTETHQDDVENQAGCCDLFSRCCRKNGVQTDTQRKLLA